MYSKYFTLTIFFFTILLSPLIVLVDLYIINLLVSTDINSNYFPFIFLRVFLTVVLLILTTYTVNLLCELLLEKIIYILKVKSATDFNQSELIKNLTIDYREIIAQGILPLMRLISDTLGLIILFYYLIFSDYNLIITDYKFWLVLLLAFIFCSTFLYFYRKASVKLQTASEFQVETVRQRTSSFASMMLPERWSISQTGSVSSNFNKKYAHYLTLPMVVFYTFEIVALISIVGSILRDPTIEKMTIASFILVRAYPMLTRIFGSLSAAVYGYSALKSIGLMNLISPQKHYLKPHRVTLNLPGRTVQLKDDQVLVISGPSGCGKSTGIRQSIVKSIEGHFEISQDVMLYETGSNYSPLVLDSLNDTEWLHLQRNLQFLGLEKILEMAPDEFRKLSEGEKQRFNVALSLCSTKRVLIFDEPTANLDEKNTLLIFELINIHRKSHSIVIITHDVDEATSLTNHVLYTFQTQ